MCKLNYSQVPINFSKPINAQTIITASKQLIKIKTQDLRGKPSRVEGKTTGQTPNQIHYSKIAVQIFPSKSTLEINNNREKYRFYFSYRYLLE